MISKFWDILFTSVLSSEMPKILMYVLYRGYSMSYVTASRSMLCLIFVMAFNYHGNN